MQRATPSVVNIFTSKEIRAPRHPLLNDPMFRRFFGDQLPDEAQRASSLGSGVIVSTERLRAHQPSRGRGRRRNRGRAADGKKLLAKVVGNDPETDLAVLRVNADNLPAITFGSSDALKVGDVVLAIGNPFGVGQTVTGGIVSALGRTGLGINTFENFIQTDAAINPGNSGGALIDAGGNLVGINTAIFSRSGGSMGIGFAIPVSTAQDGARADRQERQRDARLDRRRGAGDHAGGRRVVQARRARAARSSPACCAAGRPTRPASSPATCSSRSRASRSPTRPRCSTSSPRSRPAPRRT